MGTEFVLESSKAGISSCLILLPTLDFLTISEFSTELCFCLVWRELISLAIFAISYLESAVLVPTTAFCLESWTNVFIFSFLELSNLLFFAEAISLSALALTLGFFLFLLMFTLDSLRATVSLTPSTGIFFCLVLRKLFPFP